MNDKIDIDKVIVKPQSALDNEVTNYTLIKYAYNEFVSFLFTLSNQLSLGNRQRSKSFMMITLF